MKRSIVAAVLGLVVTGTAAFGQGHILISNYLTPPYNQIYWNANVPDAPAGQANHAVNASYGLTFQMFYGTSAGAVTSAGGQFQITTDAGVAAFDPAAGHGAGGYFINFVQDIPAWTAGSTWFFQYKVITAGYSGESAVWSEMAKIVASGVPATSSADTVPGLIVTVPEPSTFAMLGLGTAALLIFRRRS